VLTGVGTILDDDPRLDVRLVPTAQQPLRVIVDSRLRTPTVARVFDAAGDVLIATAPQAPPDRVAALTGRGAEVRVFPSTPDGRVGLGDLLEALAGRGINELHVEAGHTLNGALLDGGWVDEWLLYLAPVLLGPGRGLAQLAPLESLDDAARLRIVDMSLVGEDVRLRARPVGREDFAQAPASTAG
jgi:diaminohydroxyphosphoribosylaminopyrimidine deaminase/5-amino-6-(5-phosphoribosylamino)uracil reductase